MTEQLTKQDLDGEPWLNYANCAGLEQDIFYPSTDKDVSSYARYNEAKRVCGNCLVRDMCLMSALVEEENERYIWGMRGGQVPAERARLISIMTGRKLSQWRDCQEKPNVNTANLEALALVLYAEGDLSRRKSWDKIKQSRRSQNGQK